MRNLRQRQEVRQDEKHDREKIPKKSDKEKCEMSEKCEKKVLVLSHSFAKTI